MILWGQKHLDKCYKNLVHNECSHSVVHKYYCTNCNKVVEISELSVQEPNILNTNDEVKYE